MSESSLPQQALDDAPSGRRRRLTRLLVLGLPFLLLGTAPAGAEEVFTVEPPPPGLSRLYFYRESAPLMMALSPQVIVNGKSVGELGLGAVFFRDAKPGRYRIFLSGDTEHVVELNLLAGEIGYVRATLRIGFGTTRISAERITAAVASREIGQILKRTPNTEHQTTLR